jgi:hypothetical protein
MKEILLTLLIGIVAGVIDVLPMLKMKIDKYSIASAFVFYLILPFIILNTNLFGVVWWLKGGIIGFGLALPVIILAAKDDKKSIFPMTIMSVILGTLIGVAGYYF